MENITLQIGECEVTILNPIQIGINGGNLRSRASDIVKSTPNNHKFSYYKFHYNQYHYITNCTNLR